MLGLPFQGEIGFGGWFRGRCPSATMAQGLRPGHPSNEPCLRNAQPQVLRRDALCLFESALEQIVFVEPEVMPELVQISGVDFFPEQILVLLGLLPDVF